MHLSNEQKYFIDRVTEYAILNHYPITEAGFEDALRDYVHEWFATFQRAIQHPEECARLAFAQALAMAHAEEAANDNG